MKRELLIRVITSTASVALAIALDLWLTRAPLAAAPATPPVKIAPEPVLASPPAPIRPATPLTVIAVPVEVEIAAAAEPSPAAKPAEPKPEPKPAHQPRRGLFRRR